MGVVFSKTETLFKSLALENKHTHILPHNSNSPRKVPPRPPSNAYITQATMGDKILRSINTICLNFSPFPPLPQAML